MLHRFLVVGATLTFKNNEPLACETFHTIYSLRKKQWQWDQNDNNQRLECLFSRDYRRRSLQTLTRINEHQTANLNALFNATGSSSLYDALLASVSRVSAVTSIFFSSQSVVGSLSCDTGALIRLVTSKSKSSGHYRTMNNTGTTSSLRGKRTKQDDP
jgi:hypothetical protein